MTTSEIGVQYATGLSRRNIEQALIAAGKDTAHLAPADLGTLEDFHTMGRIATGQLAELAAITGTDRVLDAGAGIGGTARFLAAQYGCQVTAVDLTSEYCETAEWLNQLTGLDQAITVRQADVTDLPFADAAFDVMTSQHVQMNVADKARLYAEARRVLVTGGRLAIWDVTEGEPGPVDYPLPWADQPGRSHLVPAARLRVAIEAAGFAVGHWADLTADAAALMRAVLADRAFARAPLGLHAFVPDFAAKAANLTEGLAAGRLRVIQAVAVAGGLRVRELAPGARCCQVYAAGGVNPPIGPAKFIRPHRYQSTDSAPGFRPVVKAASLHRPARRTPDAVCLAVMTG